MANEANSSMTDGDFGTDMPEGFTEVQQTRLWVVKEEGAILQGVLLTRKSRKNNLKPDEPSFFYEMRIVRECKTTTADEDDGKKKVEYIARPGQIVCIDEFAGNGNWQHQLPAGGKGTEIWMKFVRKDKLDGAKTMWKVKQGQRSINMKEVVEDNIPF